MNEKRFDIDREQSDEFYYSLSKLPLTLRSKGKEDLLTRLQEAAKHQDTESLVSLLRDTFPFLAVALEEPSCNLTWEKIMAALDVRFDLDKEIELKIYSAEQLMHMLDKYALENGDRNWHSSVRWSFDDTNSYVHFSYYLDLPSEFFTRVVDQEEFDAAWDNERRIEGKGCLTLFPFLKNRKLELLSVEGDYYIHLIE
jgi:hypothetical protein